MSFYKKKSKFQSHKCILNLSWPFLRRQSKKERKNNTRMGMQKCLSRDLNYSENVDMIIMVSFLIWAYKIRTWTFYKNYESKYKFRAYMNSSWSYSPFSQLVVLYRLIYSKGTDSSLPLKIKEYKSNDPSGDKKENMGRPN